MLTISDILFQFDKDVSKPLQTGILNNITCDEEEWYKKLDHIKFVKEKEIIEINRKFIGNKNPLNFNFSNYINRILFTDVEFVRISKCLCIIIDSITKNHSFLDGNKRTAAETVLLFLEINGYEFNIKTENDNYIIASIIYHIASNSISIDKCEMILNSFVIKK